MATEAKIKTKTKTIEVRIGKGKLAIAHVDPNGRIRWTDAGETLLETSSQQREFFLRNHVRLQAGRN